MTVRAAEDVEFRVEEAVEPIRLEWDELSDRARVSPFLRPGWIEAWSRSFAGGTLELLTARRDGRLSAVLPVMRRADGVFSPTNSHSPDYGITADDADSVAAVAEAVFARASGRVRLAFLEVGGAALEACRAEAQRAGFLVWERTQERSPYLPIEGDWTGYAEGRSGKLLRDLRRRRRLLEREGDVTIEVADGRERLDELLAQGYAVEPSGWKAAGETAIASHPETRRFYTDVAHWAAARGWLRLAFLRLDGEPLAFQFGLEQGGVYYFVKGGYDPAHHRFAPGKLLVLAMLERAFEEELARFEFLGSEETWKLEWTDLRRERKALSAYPPTLSGRFRWAADAYGRPLVRRARRRFGLAGFRR